LQVRILSGALTLFEIRGSRAKRRANRDAVYLPNSADGARRDSPPTITVDGFPAESSTTVRGCDIWMNSGLELPGADAEIPTAATGLPDVCREPPPGDGSVETTIFGSPGWRMITEIDSAGWCLPLSELRRLLALFLRFPLCHLSFGGGGFSISCVHLRALSPSERLGRRTFEGLNINLTAAVERLLSQRRKRSPEKKNIQLTN
jgi:hypothetical protein